MKMLIITLGFLFFLSPGYAMKPVPFKNVRYVDPVTKYEVHSEQKEGPGHGGEGSTKIFNNQQRLLWSLPVFIGRHLIHLSPDGESLVLSGNFFFGGVISLSAHEVLGQVYEKGQLVKKLHFPDVFSEGPMSLEEKLKLPVKGGGWVDSRLLLKDFQIDWKKKTLEWKLYDDSLKKFSFEEGAKEKMNLELKHTEEKTLAGTLKIKFLSFSHEHSSSAPGEPSSATTGIFHFEITEGGRKEKLTVETDAQGRSQLVRLFSSHNMKILKASPDQKTLTIEITLNSR